MKHYEALKLPPQLNAAASFSLRNIKNIPLGTGCGNLTGYLKGR